MSEEQKKVLVEPLSVEEILDILHSKKEASWESILPSHILQRQAKAIHEAQMKRRIR